PTRHLARGEFHHVGQEAERRFDWEDRFVLRLDFFKNVGLDGAAKFRDDAGAKAPLRRRNIHCHYDRRRAADRHRGGAIWRAEIESVVEPDHVLDGVDRDAALADLAEDSRRIGIDAVKRRAVECGAEAFRPLMTTEEMKTLVR